MAQISSAPLPMLPYTLGQIAVRSGSLPEGMLRSGQSISMQVLQSSQAGEATQVRIAGRTLQAVLPTAVQAGDSLVVRVGRSAEGTMQMQLTDNRPPPALKPPARDIQSLSDQARGGILKVNVEESSKGALTVKVGNRSYTPEELGARAESLPRGSWTARIENGRLTPFRETTQAQLTRTPPSLTPQGREIQENLQAAGRGSSGNLLVRVLDTPRGVEIQIAGRSYAPGELGVRAAELPRGAWTARLSAQGANLTLAPANSEAAQIRQMAGNLAVSGDPLAVQAAVELAASQTDNPNTYSPDGVSDTGEGVPWVMLPGGQAAAIQMGPARLEDESQGSAHIELWGNHLGPLSIGLLRNPAGIQISVKADPEVADSLKAEARVLSERVRAQTGLPSQVTVHTHAARPLPPEGFESYG